MALDLLQDVIPIQLHSAVPEVRVYLIEAFGNATRIDYGTGHEISFVMFMCCLFKIGFLKEDDKIAAVTKIFQRLVSKNCITVIKKFCYQFIFSYQIFIVNYKRK